MNLPVQDGASEANPVTESSAQPSDVAGGRGDGEPDRAPRLPSRKQLDEIFGDVLPSVTQDELDDRDGAGGDDRERWYRDNRPPHHG